MGVFKTEISGRPLWYRSNLLYQEDNVLETHTPQGPQRNGWRLYEVATRELRRPIGYGPSETMQRRNIGYINLRKLRAQPNGKFRSNMPKDAKALTHHGRLCRDHEPSPWTCPVYLPSCARRNDTQRDFPLPTGTHL